MSSEAGVTDLWIMLGPHGLLALGKQFVTQTASLWQVGSGELAEQGGSGLLPGGPNGPQLPPSLHAPILPRWGP
jgi:hypothetical protein